MFVAHGHAFVLFLVLAAVSCVATVSHRARFARILRLRALVPAVSLAAYVAWLERGTTTPAGSVPVSGEHLAPHFQGALDKLSLLLTPTLLTRFGVDVVAGLALWAIVICAAVATIRVLRAAPVRDEAAARSIAHSRALYAGALTISVLFLLLPHAI